MDIEVRLARDGAVIWSQRFKTGEANMTHSLANMEHHHFKYPAFRRPGDLHCHFLGTAALSFAAGVAAQTGDRLEIESATFGRPLRNEDRGGLISVTCLEPLQEVTVSTDRTNRTRWTRAFELFEYLSQVLQEKLTEAVIAPMVSTGNSVPARHCSRSFGSRQSGGWVWH